MSYLPSIPFPNGAAFAGALAPPIKSAGRPEPTADERIELLGLVTRAQAGDLGAQSELVRRYTKRISAFVRPIIGQPSALDDVVQMVFIKMIRRLGVLREPATFESWLFVVARNTALDFLRRARSRPATVADDGDFAQMPDTSNAQDLPEIMEALDVALTRLSPKDRNLVRLIVQGVSYRAAAAREGLTVGAVKLRLTRVRPFLRASVSSAIGLPVPGAENFRLPPRGRVAA